MMPISKLVATALTNGGPKVIQAIKPELKSEKKTSKSLDFLPSLENFCLINEFI